MKKFFALLYAGLFGILTSCETILPLDMPEGEEWGITLNAVASPDTTFYAYVTHCYPNSEAPDYAYKNQSYENYWEPDPYLDYFYSMLYAYYKGDDAPPFNNQKGYNLIKESVLTDAKVELTVNGETIYPMIYDTLMLCYKSNYIPAVGDRLEVKINTTAGEETVAQTKVPHPQKLEILETKTDIFEKIVFLREPWPFIGYNRGYVNMRLRLNDPAEEKNYYRLVVRGIVQEGGEAAKVWDTYQSIDPIFRDERLTSTWGAWNAYFSNVFDDSLIDGESYELNIQTYILTDSDFYNHPWPTYEVSLQSITEDYYHYLKSMELYRISRSNTYSEGVYIHSNNEGGWGLLGGISGEVHIVEPFKDMN